MGSNISKTIRETIQHGVIYGFGSILSAGIGFLLIPLYTRLLSPSDYGILSLLTITSSIAGTVFQMGMNSAMFRSYYDYDDAQSRSRVISSAFYILLTSFLLLAILGYFLSPFLSRSVIGDSAYTKYLYLAIATTGFGFLSALPFSVYRARKLPKKYVFFRILFFTLSVGAIIYFVAIALWGIWGVILANFLVSLISAGTLLFTIRGSLKLAPSWTESSRMLSFGLPLIPQNISGFVLTSAASYFLRAFCTTADVGIYNLGYKFGDVFRCLLILPLSMVWSPAILSIKDEDFADEYYSRALSYFMLIGGWLVLCLSLLSKEAIQIMSDESFWDAYKIVPLIAISCLFMGTQRILSVGISLKRKTQYGAAVFIAGALLNLVLNYFLIPRFAMWGAALATAISYLSINVMKYPIVMKLHKVEYEWKRITKITFCGIALYFIGIRIDTGNILVNLTLKTFVSISFPVLLIPMKFYQEAEKRKLGEMWASHAPSFLVPSSWGSRE